MDTQLSVRIPKDLNEALREASRRSGTKRAEIVRAALREHLLSGRGVTRPPPARVAHLLGSLESGIPDLAEKHREYLLTALMRE